MTRARWLAGWLLLGGLALSFFAPGRLQAQTPAAATQVPPVTYQDLLRLLEQRLGEQEILQRLGGTTFVLGAAQEAQLRQAGASERLLAALRQPPRPDEAPDTANWVIVFDCSGSMREPTKEGGSKMEVARQALVELLQNTPNGLQVAFIIYGHDVAQKCQAVQVVRSLNRLDDAGREELRRIIVRLQPAGHTPIALALERAGQELARGSAPGGVVLITDGMETCHGDPVAVARKLNLPRGVNVVGLDVSAEERKAVAAIAQAGNGKYYEARSGIELSRQLRVVQRKLVAPTRIAEGARIQAHTERVHYLAFSPDSKLLVSASADQTARLWDLSTGKTRTIFRGHSGWLSQAAFAPNGKILATGSADHTVKLWDTATGKEIMTLQGHRDTVRAVVFSRDGKMLISASEDRTVRLWEVASGKMHAELTQPNAIHPVALAPDGRQLAVSTFWDGTVRLWDIVSARERLSLKADPETANALAFGLGGKVLCTGGTDRTVRLWEVASGKLLRALPERRQMINGLAPSPDGKFLVSVDGDWREGTQPGTVTVWDLATGKDLAAWTLKGGCVYGVAFAPDGSMFATGEHDGTVRVFRLPDGMLPEGPGIILDDPK